MMSVRAKKHLGQHFLTDLNISKKIADQFSGFADCKTVLEIGPGTGAITQFLIKNKRIEELHVMEVDRDSIRYLQEHFPSLNGRIYNDDFLKTDINLIFKKQAFSVVGNFPYHISSQILFKCIDHYTQVPEIMGMFQKEVAERVAEKPGSKKYGILSVLLQTYYDIEYLFTVDEHVFNPPPKVKSGVIRCTRNKRISLTCDEVLFKKIVKATFNQRRKMIRNGLKTLIDTSIVDHEFFNKRPEQLSVEDFIELTQFVEASPKL